MHYAELAINRAEPQCWLSLGRLTHSGNVVRLDLQQDPLLARSPVLILFGPSVLLGHLVDVRLSDWSSNLLDDTTSNHYELVGIPLLRNRQSDLRILLDVLMLDTAYSRVNENVVAISINPSWSNLRGTISVYCCEEYEILAF
jgi:hypothetical protein